MNAGCGFGVLLLYRDPAVLPALSLVSQQSCGGGLIAEDLKRAVLLEQVTASHSLTAEQVTDSRRLLWCKPLLGSVKGAA